jgi:hypothetical protein
MQRDDSGIMTYFPMHASLRLLVAGAITVFALSCAGQAPPFLPPGSPTVTDPAPASDKRVLWIIPNYRTVSRPAIYKPITPKEKFAIAIADSFDRGTFALAAAFAGEGQLTKSNPSFGNGIEAYGRYFGTAYADIAVGDFMTEAIYPTILHQDPRYFRRGTGTGLSRLGYAAGQIFWTHNDSGRTQFNYSEIVGNATAVAISNAYYPDGRNVGSAVSKLGSQIGVDMVSNILKEFWPDIRKKLTREAKTSASAQSFTVQEP